MLNFVLKSLSLLFVIFSFSCATVHYPSSLNVPLHDHAGDTKVEAAVNLSSVVLKGSHAINENFAINTSASYWAWSYSVNGNPDAAKGYKFNVMPGVYTNLGENAIFECFGGYGFNYVNHNEPKLYQQIILQPAIGIKGNKSEIALAIRASLLPGSGYFIDPAFIWRAGGERLKFTSQIGMSLGTSPTIQSPDLLLINIGLQYTFKSDRGTIITPAF